MICEDGKICDISINWKNEGDCLGYVNCPAWPCYIENCSKVPVDLPGFCEIASCHYTPKPISPGEKAIHILMRIIIVTCLIGAVLFVLICICKKCNIVKLIFYRRSHLSRQNVQQGNELPLSTMPTRNREYFVLHSDSSSESENFETTPIIRR